MVFARRKVENWFQAVINGENARKVKIGLNFFGGGDYNARFVRDQKEDSALIALLRTRRRVGPKSGVAIDKTTVNKSGGQALLIDLFAGGRLVALFTK